jgi:hypothetical protein
MTVSQLLFNKINAFQKEKCKEVTEWKKPLHMIISNSVYLKDNEKWNFMELLHFWRTDKAFSFMSGI